MSLHFKSWIKSATFCSWYLQVYFFGRWHFHFDSDFVDVPGVWLATSYFLNHWWIMFTKWYIDGLVQDSSISSALAMEILQFSTKPSKYITWCLSKMEEHVLKKKENQDFIIFHITLSDVINIELSLFRQWIGTECSTTLFLLKLILFRLSICFADIHPEILCLYSSYWVDLIEIWSKAV